VLLSYSLWQCIGLFQKGVHRVAVIGANGKTENVLTQTDIVRFLITKIDEHPWFFDTTVKEMHLGLEKRIITCHQSAKAIKAFKLMDEHKVSAVGVVDDRGRLVGNLSASDLKGQGIADWGQGADPFGTLQMPVMSFLQQGGMTHFPVGSCTSDTTFNFLLLKVMALRVHRLWVVDKKGKPISVISLTDVMQALIAQKQEDRKE